MRGLLNSSYADNRVLFEKTYKQHHTGTIRHISISMLPVTGVWKPTIHLWKATGLLMIFSSCCFLPWLSVNGPDLPFSHLPSYSYKTLSRKLSPVWSIAIVRAVSSFLGSVNEQSVENLNSPETLLLGLVQLSSFPFFWLSHGLFFCAFR